jgi:16S rRNA (uracil1498-N3)-methyltransferase
VNKSLRATAAHVFVRDIGAPIIEKEDFVHLSKSLRLRDGETVSVSDGKGSWRLCAWRGSEAVECIGDVVTQDPLSTALTVAIAPVKGDRTDFAVEKMTEIGIDRIVVLAPLRRSVVRWDDRKTAHHIERLSRIARGAAMQSRRVFLPLITGPKVLSDALGGVRAAIADPAGSADISLFDTIAVGPEGGFDPSEYPENVPLVSLGSAILRAETAAVVAATLMVAHRAGQSDHTG